MSRCWVVNKEPAHATLMPYASIAELAIVSAPPEGKP